MSDTIRLNGSTRTGSMDQEQADYSCYRTTDFYEEDSKTQELFDNCSPGERALYFEYDEDEYEECLEDDDAMDLEDRLDEILSAA